jgi:hypothetical protein
MYHVENYMYTYRVLRKNSSVHSVAVRGSYDTLALMASSSSAATSSYPEKE